MSTYSADELRDLNMSEWSDRPPPCAVRKTLFTLWFPVAYVRASGVRHPCSIDLLLCRPPAVHQDDQLIRPAQ